MERRQQEYKEEQERREKEFAEEQARREAEEKERAVENFMFLRFIKLLVKTNNQIDNAKKTLFGHRTFNLDDCFTLFDSNKNGVISVTELHDVFAEHNIEVVNLDRVIELID
jgi:Ca2+-binding EF-hand superfamily protein